MVYARNQGPVVAMRRCWNELRSWNELKGVEAGVQSLHQRLTLKFPEAAMDRSPLAGKKRKNPPGHAPQQPDTQKVQKRRQAPRSRRHTTPLVRVSTSRGIARYYFAADVYWESSKWYSGYARLDAHAVKCSVPRRSDEYSPFDRYVPALQGVVLSHSNLAFTSDTALILPDSPFARCTITFKALVWSPRVGMKLSAYSHEISSESITHKLSEGKINLCSPDHISLLIHRTFNVSILRHHLPFEEYEFEYGPAENDPEFGVRIASEAPPGTENDQGCAIQVNGYIENPVFLSVVSSVPLNLRS
jgi:hypothetical protein